MEARMMFAFGARFLAGFLVGLFCGLRVCSAIGMSMASRRLDVKSLDDNGVMINFYG